MWKVESWRLNSNSLRLRYFSSSLGSERFSLIVILSVLALSLTQFILSSFVEPHLAGEMVVRPSHARGQPLVSPSESSAGTAVSLHPPPQAELDKQREPDRNYWVCSLCMGVSEGDGRECKDNTMRSVPSVTWLSGVMLTEKRRDQTQIKCSYTDGISPFKYFPHWASKMRNVFIWSLFHDRRSVGWITEKNMHISRPRSLPPSQYSLASATTIFPHWADSFQCSQTFHT